MVGIPEDRTWACVSEGRRLPPGTGSVAVEEVDRPALPDGAVLVRVRAGALNTIDWFLAMGKPYLARLMAGGVRRPRSHVVGREFAGTVEAVGGNVTDAPAR